MFGCEHAWLLYLIEEHSIKSSNGEGPLSLIYSRARCAVLSKVPVVLGKVSFLPNPFIGPTGHAPEFFLRPVKPGPWVTLQAIEF
jgi:hypothetical protein